MQQSFTILYAAVDGTEVVYNGITARSSNGHAGGGSNYICMMKEARYHPGAVTSASTYIYGTEYETATPSIRLIKITSRVQPVMWPPVQLHSWYQEQTSAQEDGPQSTQGGWCRLATTTKDVPCTCAWTRMHRLYLVWVHMVAMWHRCSIPQFRATMAYHAHLMWMPRI